MARPSVGTTGGHMAALYVLLGDEKVRELLGQLKQNDIKLLGGNSEVVKGITEGQIWAGLTDNDDVINAQQEGGKIAMRLPDQDGIGTLTVPTTVALVAGAKRAENARKLIDYLLSEEVEKKLMAANFARYSVRAGPQEIKAMQVDYGARGGQDAGGDYGLLKDSDRSPVSTGRLGTQRCICRPRIIGASDCGAWCWQRHCG